MKHTCKLWIFCLFLFFFNSNLKYFRCSGCGKSFTLTQELSRHVRDKVCQMMKTDSIIENHIMQDTISYQTIQILPTYAIIVPTNTVTSTITSDTAQTTTTTEVLLVSPTSKMGGSFVQDEYTGNHESIEDNSVTKIWNCTQCDDYR